MFMHLHIVRDSEQATHDNLLGLFSPGTHDFRWNDDFTAYRPIERFDELDKGSCSPLREARNPIVKLAADDNDDICF